VAARRGSRPSEATEQSVPANAAMQRLTNLIALLVVKGEPQPEQLRILEAAGYGNTEIAGLLGLKPNAVNVALHRLRKKR
jgi:DNA-directed RNA polymerase specialized sigma24 family protein